MAGVNKVIIVGNLGRDPEVRVTDGGKNVVNFSVGVTERKGQDTEWFNVTAWEKLADICATYLKKGSQVYVEGRQQTQTWEKDGEKKSKQIIVAYNMTMLGEANGNGNLCGGCNEPKGACRCKADEFEDDDIPF